MEKNKRDKFHNVVAALCVVALSLLIIGVNPFKQVLAPMDLMNSFQGWGGHVVSSDVVNPERSDILDFYLPRWRYFRSQIRKNHRIPIWNSVAEDGSYGIQEPSQFGLNIPFLIYALCPDEALGYTLAIIINFLLAALGTYLLLVFMFRSRCAAVFGSITFAFSGFNIAWAYWPHAITAACIPWVLASMLQYWQRAKLRWAYCFMVSVFLLEVGGFPFVSFLGCLLIVAFASVLIISAVRKGTMSSLYWQRLGCLVIAGIGATALAFPGFILLLRTLEHADLSYRTGGTVLNVKDVFDLLGVGFGTRISVEKTFFCGTLAAIFSICAVIWSIWKPNKNAVLGALIALFVLGTAYGMAPNYIVMHIPFFSTNSWNRVGSLIGLSFAILSAYFLASIFEFPKKKKWHICWLTAYVVFLIFQSWQLSYQFSIYNSKSSRKSFLPLTPQIDYLVKNLEPLQSVIADSSFAVSGTLGSYHIPELLGHGFRTKAQKKIIENIAPHSEATPTASRVDCAEIDPDARDATYAGVKYYIVRSPCGSSVFQTHGKEAQPSPDLNKGALSGKLYIPRNLTVDSIHVLFATYNRIYSGPDINFVLYKNNNIVARSTLSASKVFDNKYGNFNLSEETKLNSGYYNYIISIAKPESYSPLSVWMFSSSGDNLYMVNGKRYSGTPRMELYRKSKLEEYPKSFSKDNIQIINNPNVKGSGYYINSLYGTPSNVYSNIKLLNYSPEDFEFLYTGDSKGWIVAPMRYVKGWKAEVNGYPVSVVLFRGVFPAVYVSGNAKVKFYYEPIDFYFMITISAFVLVLCIVMLLFLHRRCRKHPCQVDIG